MARRIYATTPDREKDEKKKHLAKILSVSERTVRDWLSRIDKDSKEARNRRIFDLWLACWQNSEIADEVGLSAPQITEIVSNFGIGNLAKTEIAHAEHATDFDPPIYNVWKQQEKTAGFPALSFRCNMGPFSAGSGPLEKTEYNYPMGMGYGEGGAGWSMALSGWGGWPGAGSAAAVRVSSAGEVMVVG